MKDKIKIKKIEILVLSLILLALFAISPMLGKWGTWIAIYFCVVIIVAIPLRIILSGPLTAFIEKYWE
jgi:hypothetical protein